MSNLPLFLPVLLGAALFGGLLRRPVARRLRSSVPAAWLLVASLGLIVGATLTPLESGIAPVPAGGSCDLSRFWFAPLAVYLRFDDPGLNVLLFVPLGVAAGLVRPGPMKRLVVVGGFLIPVAIELTQLKLPVLQRACESGDVVDNCAGFAIGLLATTLTCGLLDMLASRT